MGYLLLRRRVGEVIKINDDIEITIVETNGGNTLIGIQADEKKYHVTRPDAKKIYVRGNDNG